MLENTKSLWEWLLRSGGTLIDNNAGFLLIGAGQACFATMDVAVKKANEVDPSIPVLELILIRMAVTYTCCISYMYYHDISDFWFGPAEVRGLLILRGLFSFLSIFGLYYSLIYLPLSTATVLTLVPFCTAISGTLFLKEDFLLREALAGAFSLSGVVLIARPPFLFGENPGDGNGENHVDVAQRLMAVGVALLGVLGTTGGWTTIRIIGKRSLPVQTLTAYACMCVVGSTILMCVMGIPFIKPTHVVWWILVLVIGIFGFFAQILSTMGLQRDALGRGTIAIYTQIVFALILERIFFGYTIPYLSAIGTGIILSAALYTVLTKKRTQEVRDGSDDEKRVLLSPEEHPNEENSVEQGH
ncbi:drug metabolite transporter superfamily [Moniliophthora roreri MCA 2997]|uniref:Drug metabolite transporter superfamily n=1 Tax=Moniliophthora roreri (strain MCA 2997) TaxID=1381753 RepID=V2X578_MONRO|nr:drug metabolite transporter superfamily [Moniliophthora roreri MCA 2997]